MIQLSVKGLADYMTASASKQRSILRGYKYPRDDESQAKRLYYRDARDRIAAYHKNHHDATWLGAKAEELAQLAALTGGASGTRLRHNARALRLYERHFSTRSFTYLGDLRLQLTFAGVRISVTPDLYVREGAKEKIVKLEFGVDEPHQDAVKVVSQCMFEAAKGQLPQCTSTSVLYLDVPRNLEHRGARANARTLREIETTCENIARLWDII